MQEIKKCIEQAHEQGADPGRGQHPPRADRGRGCQQAGGQYQIEAVNKRIGI